MDEPAEPKVSESVHGELGLGDMSGPTRWVLLEGDRRVLAGGLVAALAVGLWGCLQVGVVGVADGGPLTRLFSSFVTGNLTLITVVITINQLILSREFGTPGELRDRIEEVSEYRHEVEAVADADVSPMRPDAFLEFLASETSALADDVRAEVDGVEDAAYRESVERFAETLDAQAETIRSTLTEQRRKTFHGLVTILDTDFTSDRYTAERLQATAGDDAPPALADRLGDLVDVLEYIGAARQYFETLYMQQELAALSRKILLAGLPAIVASLLAVWLYGDPTGTALSTPVLEVVIVVATAVALGPLAILFAYILRITTITRRTVSLMPFRTDEMHTA